MSAPVPSANASHPAISNHPLPTARPPSQSGMRTMLASFVLGFTLLPQLTRADLAEDYAALTAGVQGQTATPVAGASLGSVAMFGQASFPVLYGVESPMKTAMAAGRHGDSYAATASRGVAWGHTSFFDTAGGTRTTLFSNSVLWASRQAAPAGTIAVVVSNSGVANYLTGLGYTVRSRSSSLTPTDLTGAHVLVLGGNTDYSDTVMGRISSFTNGGGGIVMSSTPWAASTGAFADSNAVLDPFGLVMNGSGPEDDSFDIEATPWPAITSALPGADALIADKEGTTPMTLAERSMAANAIFQVVGVRIDIPSLSEKLALLGDAAHYGKIAPTLAAPINVSLKPVEKMLARYQSQTFDVLPTPELFVHPCAADFPGMPDAGATTVSRTVSVNGNTPTDFYMNQGNKPIRIETGLYAPPGAAITVTVPTGITGQGLQVHISGNGSEDRTFDKDNWTFFPKLWRRVPLATTTTETGHVLGGLITLLVPPGKSLGTFNVTIDGAIEAPAFVLGQTTDEQWNGGIKNNPAPYGYVQTPKITLYLPKWQLVALSNPTEVATYWQKVMDTADEYYGYTNYRKRGEAIATARYVSAGAAYAGYPVEAGWGSTSESMLNSARLNGSWGDYHELGHGYQDDFNSAFGIAIGAEIDVNLMPGMIYTLVHDRTSWDGAHSSYNATDRLSKRNAFLATPAAEQTWQEACDLYPVAYDFYFNLAEAFGWDCYKTALGRLMRYLQSPTAATDAALHALSISDPNFKRNRFYLLFCDATGRNLDTYFQRYGLGSVGKGFEITQSVKDQVAAKNYPVWTDNTAIDDLGVPAEINISEDIAPGSMVHQLVATDAEEPGTIWDYRITAGNTNNAFSIDRRTGKLRVAQVDAEALASYTLTVQVQDNGVPRFSTARTFTVNIADIEEAPKVQGRLFTATSGMIHGISLGNVTALPEPGRAITGFSIAAGNDGHFAIHPTTGSLTVSNTATLPNPGVIRLTIRAIDSTGASGYGNVTVLCNRATGVLEERWNGSVISGAPAVTSIFSTFTSPENVGTSYVRRVSGWLVPPASGAYRFWIASDDDGTLSLSSDEGAANLAPIAKVVGWTNYKTWNTQASQQSSAIYLEAGRAYYIEAVQKEGSGGDHVSVAWQGPGIAQQVIPTTALIPANAVSAFPPSPGLPSPLEQWRNTHFGVNAGDSLIGGNEADPDRDGLANLVEFMVGTSPTTSGPSPLIPQQSGDNLTVTFSRDDVSEGGGVQVSVEAGDSLQSWPEIFQIGATTETSSPGVVVTENGAAPDTISVTITTNSSACRFARIKIQAGG